MQVDDMIMEEEEEENKNKNPQTARVRRHSDSGLEPVKRQDILKIQGCLPPPPTLHQISLAREEKEGNS